MEREPQPFLRVLFETVAVAMDMDTGKETLELEFDNGHLVQWWRHDRHNRPAELARFDEEARQLVLHTVPILELPPAS